MSNKAFSFCVSSSDEVWMLICEFSIEGSLSEKIPTLIHKKVS